MRSCQAPPPFENLVVGSTPSPSPPSPPLEEKGCTLVHTMLKPTKEEAYTLSTTLCFLFPKKWNDKFKMFSDMSFCFSFKIMPSCRRCFIKCLKIYDTMDDSRYILYTNKNKKLWSLLPTPNMSQGHFLRSHCVILICSNLISPPDTNLNPTEFGWNSVDSALMPNKCIVTLPKMYVVTCGCKRTCTERYQCR